MACENRVAIFEEEWPEGVEITPESLMRAAELELDLSWYVYCFLPISARGAYFKATAPAAREAYGKVIEPTQYGQPIVRLQHKHYGK